MYLLPCHGEMKLININWDKHKADAFTVIIHSRRLQANVCERSRRKDMVQYDRNYLTSTEKLTVWLA